MPTAAQIDEALERLVATLRDCAAGRLHSRAAVEHLVVDGELVTLTWTVNPTARVEEDDAKRGDA